MRSHRKLAQGPNSLPRTVGRVVIAVVFGTMLTLTSDLSATAWAQCPSNACSPTSLTLSNYTITFLGVTCSGGNSTWCYRVTRNSGGQELSHVALGVCDDPGSPQFVTTSNVVSTSPPNTSFGTDGSTGVYGFKWEGPQLPFIPVGGSADFCFTLNRTDYVIGPVQAIPKVGNNTTPGTICGVSCSSVPTVADLKSFKATRFEDGSVVLYWETGYEVDNLGFNIYQSNGRKAKKITKEPVAGSALLAGPGTALTAGRAYSWTDSSGAPDGAQYWIEDIDLNGTATWNGPYAVEDADPTAKTSKDVEPVLLSKIDTGSTQTNQRTGRVERKAPLPTAAAEALVASNTNSPAAGGVKLSIKHEGWYRVSQTELVAAGLSADIDPRTLQLLVDGQQIPFIVTGEKDGKFDPSDAIEFYGMGIDSPYTDARTYFVAAGSEPGQRISLVKASGSKMSGSFSYTVERKDRTIYFSSLRNGETENFFGSVVSRQPAFQTLDLRGVDNLYPGDASVEVVLQGVSLVSHRVNVAVNGQSVGEINFEGQNQGLAKFSFPQSILTEGTNTITLSPLGGDTDTSLVDRIRLVYRHKFVVEDNALAFSLPGKRQVTLSGFTRSDIRVIDVTDPNSVQELAGAVKRDGAGRFTVTVGSPASGQRLLLAFCDSAAKQPAAISQDHQSSLKQPANQADLTIVAPAGMIEAVSDLQAWRQSQGMSVAVVDIEDVYDEFSFGHKTPWAIRNFLAYASTNWKTPPRFTLLVGDATFDPKNYLGKGNNDFIPTKLTETNQFETANDGWFSDFNNDGVPEIAIGRFSVRTAQEAAAMAAKTVSYDQTDGPEGMLFVSDADGSDGYSFQTVNSTHRALIPDGVPVEEVRRGEDPNAKANLIDALNRGQQIVNYAGHGSTTFWRGSLLTNSDAAVLSNHDKLSLFITMTCLNGLFHDVNQESLAEALLKAQGGAIAVFASSSITEPTEQVRMNRELLLQLFGTEPITIGEAMIRAKAVAQNADVRQTWNLFGDPTTRLR